MKQDEKLLCRVCLQCDNDDVPASSIFDESDKGFIYENLNSIAEVDIKPDDGLPDKICAECLLELENAINFKQKCETSNNILVSAATAGVALKGEEAPAEDVKEEPDEYTEYEYYLEEQSASPLELTLQPEEADEQEHPQSTLETHLKPPPKKSRAIDLQLECHDCGVLFKSKCKLKVHWFKVHLKTQLTCNICQRKFCSFYKLNEHKVNKTKKCTTMSQVDVTGEGKSRVMHCKECKHSTSCIKDMTRHLGKHNGEVQTFSCKLCPKKYNYNISLKRHMESDHDVKKIEKTCKTCGVVTFGIAKYRYHLKIHSNISVLCKICNKLVTRNNYKQHMFVHSDEKNYFCEQCGISFKRPAGLYQHKKRMHENEKKFVCDICGYSDSNRYKVNSHQQKHTDHKDFACNICGMFLPNDLQLILHKKRHARNYKCLHCDDTFFRMASLKKHLYKVHEEQADQEDVKLHDMLMLQKKEAARKHKCPQCDAKYCRKRRLENHMNRVHLLGKKMYRTHQNIKENNIKEKKMRK